MLSDTEKLVAKNYNITENFTMLEFLKSRSYPELVIYPDDEILDMIEDYTKNTVQKIRDEFGPIHILSGYRNPELNKAVGGVKNSVHQYVLNGAKIGQACDIAPDFDMHSLEEVFHWIIDNHEGLGLKTAIIYRNPALSHKNFIHIDTRISRPSFVALEKMAPGKYEIYERN